MTETDAAAGARLCPICGKPAHPGHFPFCSARCALLDLNRWLNGDYRIPTDEPLEDAPREERES